MPKCTQNANRKIFEGLGRPTTSLFILLICKITVIHSGSILPIKKGPRGVVHPRSHYLYTALIDHIFYYFINKCTRGGLKVHALRCKRKIAVFPLTRPTLSQRADPAIFMVKIKKKIQHPTHDFITISLHIFARH